MKRLHLVSTAVAASLVTACSLLVAPAALACGALFSDAVDSTVAADAQRVLAVWGEKNVSMWVQVRAAGDAGYAWVLPVPVDPEVALGDDAIFDALEGLTAPVFEVAAEPSSGGGCGSSKAGVTGDASADGVEWLQGGTLGDLSYDVLAASDAQKMVDWLEDNAYVVPEGTADALQPYADRKMRFLWAQVPAGADPVPLTAGCWSRWRCRPSARPRSRRS